MRSASCAGQTNNPERHLMTRSILSRSLWASGLLLLPFSFGMATVSPDLMPDPSARMRIQVSDAAGNVRAMEVEPPGARPGMPGATGPAKQMADEAREGVLTLGITGVM